MRLRTAQLSETNRQLKKEISERIKAQESLKMATNILEKLGQHVTTAENGASAVKMMNRDSFDMVFMDIQMPVMDGIEATKLIRDQEKDGDLQIPIIAMTAHAMKGDCEKFLNAGMSDYLPKPFDPKILTEKLKTWHRRINSTEQGCQSMHS